MIAAIVALSIAGFGFATTAVVLAIRQAGLRENNTLLESENAVLTGALEGANDEIKLWRNRRDREVATLESKLRSIRDRLADLPDSDVARDLLRGELRTLLSGEDATAEDRTDPGGA